MSEAEKKAAEEPKTAKEAAAQKAKDEEAAAQKAKADAEAEVKEDKNDAYVIKCPNPKYTGERWIIQPKLKKQVVFFKGTSQQQLTKKEAEAFLKSYPKYKMIQA